MKQTNHDSHSRTLLVIDDHPLFREGVKAIVGKTPGYAVPAEAGTAEEGLQVALRNKPDIAIVDILLPDGDGVDLTKQLLEKLPNLHVLVVSMTTDSDRVTAAFQAGAKGFMDKSSASKELIKALEAMVDGYFFIDGSAHEDIAAALQACRQNRATDPLHPLSPREIEITRLFARDMSVEKIAEQLSISPRTVENHRSNIKKKLGIKTPFEFIKYAFKHGLIDLKN